MDEEKIFLEIAKQDLKSAQILYENKLYPQAIYFLQQSVEKVAKALILNIGFPKGTGLESIFGHNIFKIIMNFFKKYGNNNNKLYYKLEQDYKQFAMKVRAKEYNFSECDLKNVLKDKDILDKFFNREEVEKMVKELMIKLPQGENTEDILLKHFLEKMSKNPIIFEEIMEIIPVGLDIGSAMFKLFLLSVITLGHENRTRYPLEDFNPLKYYTHDLPLVKHFPELSEMLSDVLSRLGNISDKFRILKKEFKRLFWEIQNIVQNEIMS